MVCRLTSERQAYFCWLFLLLKPESKPIKLIKLYKVLYLTAGQEVPITLEIPLT